MMDQLWGNPAGLGGLTGEPIVLLASPLFRPSRRAGRRPRNTVGCSSKNTVPARVAATARRGNVRRLLRRLPHQPGRTCLEHQHFGMGRHPAGGRAGRAVRHAAGVEKLPGAGAAEATRGPGRAGLRLAPSSRATRHFNTRWTALVVCTASTMGITLKYPGRTVSGRPEQVRALGDKTAGAACLRRFYGRGAGSGLAGRLRTRCCQARPAEGLSRATGPSRGTFGHVDFGPAAPVPGP